MKVIEATTEDIFIIQTLASEIWPHTFKDILPKDQISYMMEMMYSTQSLTAQLEDLNHHYLLIKDSTEYLGYTSYEINYKGTHTTKIHKIYILPSLQGKGLGELFIKEISKIAIKKGSKELSLNVNRFNKALGFYKKMGFEIKTSEDIEIGNGFLMEDFVMNKNLL